MSATPRKEQAKDALVALSLSFLIFVRVWNALLNQNYNQFFSDIARNRYDYLAGVANTLLVAAFIFWIGTRVRRGLPESVTNAGWVAMLLGMLPLADFVRRLAAHRFATLDLLGAWTIVSVVVLAVALGLWFRRWVIRWLYIGALALSPFVLIVLLNATYWGITGAVRAKKESAVIFNDPTPTKRRVIWLIFDELDQRVAFEARPSGLALPGLDRLKAASFYATAAYPPAGLTFLSIPSLLSGEIIEQASVQNRRSLLVRRFGETQAKPFPTVTTLFNRLQAEGTRVAILGWFFPYARMFPKSGTCYSRSFAFPQTQGYTGDSIVEAMGWQYVFSFAPPLLRGRFRDVYEELHAETLRVIGSPGADFIYAHYSVPHFPGVATPLEAGTQKAVLDGPEAYFGNLKLVDHAVSDILDAVEKSGSAQRTTIILTADHWWRAAAMYDGNIDYRVPLLVYTPGHTPTVFGGQINNICVNDLVKYLLASEAVTGEQVTNFFTRRVDHRKYRYGGGGQMMP